MLSKATVAACDEADGLKDGLVSAPQRCNFKPETLKCAGADAPDCLTAKQLDVVKQIYGGAKLANGETYTYGFPVGHEGGATGWQTLVNIIIPLAKPGIVIGSIFVITIVMGDFVTIGVMGGQQIASAGKIIEARLNALQFPAAAANAVILLGITIMIISALTRIVDIRKEL
jgi:hypothetical protein